MLGLANEEKARLRKQVNELIARLETIEESNKENSKTLVDTIKDFKDALENQSTVVEHYRKEIELMRKKLDVKDELNRMLANKTSISDFSLRTVENTVLAVFQSK